jgi:predicted peptidase
MTQPRHMKLKITLMLALAFMSAGMLFGEETMPKSRQTSEKLVRKVTKTQKLNYLLLLPEDYKTKKKERWPLMLFLHGMGERGSDLAKVRVHGPPKVAEKMTNFPFILVSPQCPDGAWWDNESLTALLDEVQEKYRVDTNRVYLTGLSMGGFGTWNLALTYPERFAAVVPICGGGNPIPIYGFDAKRKETLKSLPFWVFHGDKDPAVPLLESERMVNALKKYGVKEVNFTVYPGVGHDSWTQTYADPKLYEWLLSHRKGMN